MDPLGRMVMAGLVMFMIWTLVRGARTGVLYGEGWAVGVDRWPVLFAVDFALRSLLVVACLGLAAGYSLAEEKELAWALITFGR
jgi:hypothetical protein